MKTIVSYFRYFKKELVFGPLFKLAEAIFELLVPLVMARIIDVGIAQKDLGLYIAPGRRDRRLRTGWHRLFPDVSVFCGAVFAGDGHGAAAGCVSSDQFILGPAGQSVFFFVADHALNQ